ncbi:MAG TPA: hypothetical protein VHJ20_23090 [Polyangia bacterium]|nr:hypothetical protein [Polyangia bacterium]
MTFRIDARLVGERIVLALHGQLVGAEAERLLREQIVRAVAEKGCVVVDAAEMTTIDAASLAVIHAGLGAWITVEGGGEYLDLLLRR